jgi:hypothetical protein
MYNCADYTTMVGLSVTQRPKSDLTDKYFKAPEGQELSERSTLIFSAFCLAT